MPTPLGLAGASTPDAAKAYTFDSAGVGHACKTLDEQHGGHVLMVQRP